MIENGSDIIALPEHWLWPYNIASLSNIHPEFEGFGYCDERLNEACTLKGCGGIGIIWRKSIQAIPLTNIVSNRLCAIQLRLNDASCVTIIAVYLPSTNYAREDFVESFQELQSIVSACQSDGPVMIVGDFNVNVKTADRNYRNELFDNFLDANSLLVLSQTLLCQGPDYTFFTNTQNSTLDYILTDVDFYDNVLNCIVHPHHPLNLSDHLPLTTTLKLCCEEQVHLTQPILRLNWRFAVETGVVCTYEDGMNKVIKPLLDLRGQTLGEIDNEIQFVSNMMIQTAANHIPKMKVHKT